MTKAELRKARKAARAARQPMTNELALPNDTDRHGPATEFTESPRDCDARHRWAKHYDSLNGAPEGPWDQ